jgi:hypothetical protein
MTWYRHRIVPVSSVVHQYTADQFQLFTRCYYQALSSPAYGERSLSHFMSFTGHMRLSLIALIERKTINSTSPHPSVESPSLASAAASPSYGTFQESFPDQFRSLRLVTLIWGDIDPIRSSEQNKSDSAQSQSYREMKKERRERLRVSREWNSDHIQESEFMSYLRLNRINCEGYEVQKVSVGEDLLSARSDSLLSCLVSTGGTCLAIG